ncbi:MAG: A24 family peptidase, partial [Nanoarchaeota archaeon]|nr:A24 family peptidase [Nanoarchaeota archaeon]
MNEYYFLFGLAFLWTLFATIQDLKSREVANWLNFSFISSALAYRAFYSLSTKNHSFFLYGLAGLAIFFILANALYYSKVFAGGDAKLLMGYGIILPFQNITSLFFISLLFILLLFLAGAIYSIFYSFFIVSKNKIVFKKEFKEKAKKNRYVLISTLVIAIILLIYNPRSPINLALTIALLIPITYIYTKAIDKCML